MKQEDLKHYLKREDIVPIMQKAKVSIQTMRGILACRINKSAALALCFEVALLRKAEMEKKALEIVENG